MDTSIYNIKAVRKDIPSNYLNAYEFWLSDNIEEMGYFDYICDAAPGIYIIENSNFIPGVTGTSQIGPEPTADTYYVGQSHNVRNRMISHFNNSNPTQAVDKHIKNSREKQLTILSNLTVIYCKPQYLNFLERYYQLAMEKGGKAHSLNRKRCGLQPLSNQMIPPITEIHNVDLEIYNQTKHDFYVWEEEMEFAEARKKEAYKNKMGWR